MQKREQIVCVKCRGKRRLGNIVCPTCRGRGLLAIAPRVAVERSDSNKTPKE